ncbi:MAG: hypothetical protein AAF492_12880, partial [Verrucomicrobiota bacterium]
LAIVVLAPEILFLPLLGLVTLLLMITPRYDETVSSADSFSEKALYGWPSICFDVRTTGASEVGKMVYQRDIDVRWLPMMLDLFAAVVGTTLVIFSKVAYRTRLRQIREEKAAAGT